MHRNLVVIESQSPPGDITIAARSLAMKSRIRQRDRQRRRGPRRLAVCGSQQRSSMRQPPPIPATAALWLLSRASEDVEQAAEARARMVPGVGSKLTKRSEAFRPAVCKSANTAVLLEAAIRRRERNVATCRSAASVPVVVGASGSATFVRSGAGAAAMLGSVLMRPSGSLLVSTRRRGGLPLVRGAAGGGGSGE